MSPAPAFLSFRPKASGASADAGPRSIRPWVSIVLAVVGTGGCGTVAIESASRLASSIRSGNESIAQRLTVIEGKLDAWREEQHQAKARMGTVDRELDRQANYLRQLETLIETRGKEDARIRYSRDR